MLRFKILSKPGCHLCDEAKEIVFLSVNHLAAEIEMVNIEEDPALFAEYSNDIPVIFLNERKIFKHRVDPEKLKKIIAAEAMAKQKEKKQLRYMDSMIPIYLIAGLILGLIFVLVAFAIKRKTRLILFVGLFFASLIYVFFALRGNASGTWVIIEIVGVIIFTMIGYFGLRGSPWWLSIAWALHPIWDLGLHYFGPGRPFTPVSYAMACLTWDLLVAVFIAYKILKGTHPAIKP
jgi:glutaredoxin